ncbi:MAG: alanine--tRNA ligase [Gemmatimonadales bacterium]
MNSAAIRRRFLDFFVAHGHTEVPSSSLEPKDDPSLLFTNAGMVQFKRTFLGQEPLPYSRATSCQKCVRAGGKHNDLEQVGYTRRHHTFFEMLGNFSFGDYFKRDAIKFAWEFVTSSDWLAIPADRLRVTVHHTDAEARKLWQRHARLPNERIYGLGDTDNFWQMGDTGPCGPCSEIYVDLDWKPGDKPAAIAPDDFVALAERGRFLEIWNLVFMQFDRAADGTMTPLPKPSVDTGAGLERIAAVMQDVDDNFHTDLFRPLIAEVGGLVGRPYPGGPANGGVSYRVLADHSRAVTFLLLDGVYPSNEGRGFVLRRILRRAVRHAWLLGRREPTLAPLVPEVIVLMGDAYPALRDKEGYISDVVRQEEQRFLETIEAGLDRLEQLRASGEGRITGSEAFRLFDTYGFPIDLTQLIASEWGIGVDVSGFEHAMDAQRQRSRAAQRVQAVAATGPLQAFADLSADTGTRSRFVGYETTDAETRVVRAAGEGDRFELVVEDNPFYAAGGGQISDTGAVAGDGWKVLVADVLKDPEFGFRLVGRLEGDAPVAGFHALAAVDRVRRADIERNHSATHLVHMVLRRILGPHVRQQGSLVEPGRLRFDFSHHGPIDPGQLTEIEVGVNELILANAETETREMTLDKALDLGAMAFFADKYGEVVRVVRIGDSIELCGGTHVRSAGQIGLFRFSGQGGVAAGVRRIEAVTGRAAYGGVRELDARIATLAGTLRAQPDHLERRIEALLSERERLEAELRTAMASGGGETPQMVRVNDVDVYVQQVPSTDRDFLTPLADAFRRRHPRHSAVLYVSPDGSPSFVSGSVSPDLVDRAGSDARSLIKTVIAHYGGRGGGSPTYASGSLGSESSSTLSQNIQKVLANWPLTP